MNINEKGISARDYAIAGRHLEEAWNNRMDMEASDFHAKEAQRLLGVNPTPVVENPNIAGMPGGAQKVTPVKTGIPNF